MTLPAATWLRVDGRSSRLDLVLSVDGPTVDDSGAGGVEALEVITAAAGELTVSVEAAAGDGGDDRVLLRLDTHPAGSDDVRRVATIDALRGRHHEAMRRVQPLERGSGLGRADAEELTGEFDALAAAWAPVDRPDLAAEALTYQARISTTVFEDSATSKPLLERALALPDVPAIARGTLLNDLAVVEDRLGNPGASLANLEAATALGRNAGDQANYAVQTSNLGLAYFRHGRYEEGLARQREAADTFRRLGMPDREALTLSDLAGTWDALGDSDTALAVQRQAVAIARTARSPLAQAVALGNLGRRLQRLGRTDEARAALDESLRLAVTLGNRRIESAMLAALGQLELDAGHSDAALAHAVRASELATAIGNPVSEGTALMLRGEGLQRSNDLVGARQAFDAAIRRFTAAGDDTDLAEALRLRARVHVAEGDLVSALADLERAIEAGESARTELLAPDARATHARTRDRLFTDFIDVCLRQHVQSPEAGHAAAAFAAFERLRAASLRDLLAEARADVRSGGDPALISRERALRDALEAKQRALAAASGRAPASRLTAGLTSEVAGLQADLRVVDRRLREGSPRYAALTSPALLTATDIRQRVLDDDTVIVSLVRADTRSWLLAVTRERLLAAPLPAGAVLDEAAGDALRVLQTPRGASGRIPALQRLSDLVLGPIAPELAGPWHGRRLAVIATGALEYVPLAALPYPSTSPPGHAAAIGLDRDVVSLPSASVVHDLRRDLAGRPPAPSTAVVVADPVFSADDPRVPPSAASPPALAPLARLPFTREEAAAIASLIPAGSRRIATGFDATRDFVTGGGLAGYRVVHIATHGVFDASHPELSGLTLSLVDRQGRPRPGFLRADAIFNLKVDADLVVLSACETALGRVLRGEGLTGMTRAWMYAGAPRVIASLWRVDDAATAALMRHFYDALLRERRSPADALAVARRAVAARPAWRAPYYWAGFVLQGDWR